MTCLGLSLSVFPVCLFCSPSTSDKTSASWRPTGRKMYSASGSFPLPPLALTLPSPLVLDLGSHMGNGNYAILLVTLSKRKDEIPCLLEDVDKQELEK